MTAKTLRSSHIATAVAPVSFGFMKLGSVLESACDAAGLIQTSHVRLLGTEERWAAVEIAVALGDADIKVARGVLAKAFEGRADIALIPARNRKKRLLISDMDSTIIEQECLDELAAYAGLKDEIAAITARAMAGELDFEGALTERVGKLVGLPLTALQQCYDERITLMPGAKTLTATMAANRAYCLLVSGGFTFFTSRVAEAAGFQGDRGNVLLDNGTALTGAVARPILGREAKLDALDDAAFANGLNRHDAIAMGDGANDLAMIEAAGMGLAVHAKPIVAEAADAAINLTDLTAALYFQGYSDSEIVWRE
ncbi:MAG: phosphoserine phosphatase SerB [Henriciella sp.]|nr:phosphoserine phosphatase SerB [Hyphomonadaceae bacterium]